MSDYFRHMVEWFADIILGPVDMDVLYFYMFFPVIF